ELRLDQLLDGFDRLGLVLPVGADGDDRAFAGGEQEDAQDGLAVDFLVALLNLDRRLEARRGVHHLRGGAGVQAELVLDLDLSGDHCVVTVRRSDATLMAFEPFSVMVWASEVTSRAWRCMVANFTIMGR